MALETTATFIGHNECFGLSAEKLKNTIRELIKKGVTDFLSGGQGGFDRLCGRCVYELKKELQHTCCRSIQARLPLQFGSIRISRKRRRRNEPPRSTAALPSLIPSLNDCMRTGKGAVDRLALKGLLCESCSNFIPPL